MEEMNSNLNMQHSISVNAELPILYCNLVDVSSGVYDFQIDFGIQFPVKKMLSNSLEDLESYTTETQTKKFVRIVMSPQHVKALANILLEHINTYESNFKLELPTGLNNQK